LDGRHGSMSLPKVGSDCEGPVMNVMVYNKLWTVVGKVYGVIGACVCKYVCT